MKKLLNKIFKKNQNHHIVETEDKMAQRVKPWFAVAGDKTLRLDYDLDENSLVFDIGGYEGNWTSEIFNKYACNVHIFEPVRSFYTIIKNKFSHNKKTVINNFGLSNISKTELICLSADKSSVFEIFEETEEIKLVKISDYINNNNIEIIDLIKINIEGGEYDLLTDLIETGLVSKVKNIQVQFHDFIDNSEQKMLCIQEKLSETHEITYQYKYVWENWKLKE